MKTNDELIPSAPTLANTMLVEVDSCPTMKVCSKCNEIKVISSFVKSKKTKNGYANYCNQCRQKNRNYEKEKDYNKKWNLENKEKCLGYSRKSGRIFRDKLTPEQKKQRSQQSILSRKKNPETRQSYLLYRNEWRKNNIQKEIERQRKWRANNQDKVKESSKKTHLKFRERELNRSLNQRVTLSNNYVIRSLRLSGFSRQDIDNNPELIEVKRLIIKTKRLCRTSQN